MSLLLLFACVSPSKAPPATEDVVRDSRDSSGTTADTQDSAADSVDTTDSNGTTETGDTAIPDTGETTPPLPCFADIASPVDYLSSGAILNSTCTGTNHQNIAGVQRVVFVGDSVTAGAPIPTDWSSWDLTDSSEWYRNVLAQEFVARWGLSAPDWFWENVSLTSGESYTKLSGDFGNCSKWGARTDDLAKDNSQLADCIPEDQRDKHTLVVMTIGGNDLFNLLDHIKNQDVDEATMRAEWQEAIVDLQNAIHLLRDPTVFPGGVAIIVADIFDVTDATSAADIARCEGAQAIGLSDPLVNPLTAELAIQWQEALLQLSVDEQIDVAFMGEAFCGHGYNWDDATGRCYRGGDPNIYFDASCEHPSRYGHAAIAATMLGVVDE